VDAEVLEAQWMSGSCEIKCLGGVVGLIANRMDEQRNERRSDDACWAPAAEQRRPMERICCLWPVGLLLPNSGGWRGPGGNDDVKGCGLRKIS
jgi:hypothetical protein